MDLLTGENEQHQQQTNTQIHESQHDHDTVCPPFERNDTSIDTPQSMSTQTTSIILEQFNLSSFQPEIPQTQTDLFPQSEFSFNDPNSFVSSNSFSFPSTSNTDLHLSSQSISSPNSSVSSSSNTPELSPAITPANEVAMYEQNQPIPIPVDIDVNLTVTQINQEHKETNIQQDSITPHSSTLKHSVSQPLFNSNTNQNQTNSTSSNISGTSTVTSTSNTSNNISTSDSKRQSGVTRRWLGFFNPFGSATAASATGSTSTGTSKSGSANNSPTQKPKPSSATKPKIEPIKDTKIYTYSDFTSKMKQPQAADLVRTLKA
jgi:hypothetical protein